MRISKKFDRAFQWATEKIGVQEKTLHSEEFKQLETEMAIRSQGTDRLHKSITAFVKWLSRKGDNADDGQKVSSTQYLGRTLNLHGEDFEPDSDYGRRLIALGRANERCATFQEQLSEIATATWLESLVRSQAMMREYMAARKKLESRRISFDASTSKVQKLRKEDVRIEEELRIAKAKFEESCENVMRRMQDIKEGEDESIRDLAAFLDAQLDFHNRCAEELRRVRNTWGTTKIGRSISSRTSSSSSSSFRPAFSLRGRTNTAPALYHGRGKDGRKQGAVPADRESSPETSSTELTGRLPGRLLPKPLPDAPTRSVPAKSAPIKPFLERAATFQGSPAGQQDTAAQTNIVAMRARAFNKLTLVVDENEKGLRETNSTRNGAPPVPSRASKPEAPTRRIQVGY